MVSPRQRLRLGRALLGILGIVLGSTTLAQPQARLELGFGGETVTEHWNPLRLTLRNVRSAELIISIDQGSLQTGETLALYRADVSSGGGVTVFEDELFLPQWRHLSWRLEAPERLIASGTLDRRRLDPRPLTLIVSAAPGRWRGLLDELPLPSADEAWRSIDVPPSLLPERLAAYDGVRTVFIDGTAAMPDLEAILAAASAGADVIALDPLPGSHQALEGLIAPGVSRLGAGRLIRVPEERLAQVLIETAPLPDLSPALITEDLSALPQSLESLPVLIAVGLYLLAVLLLIRLAGAPGLVASLALAALASVAAWSYLRPGPAQTLRGRSLVVGGGPLARLSEVRTVFTLPQDTLRLDSAARPLTPVPYVLGKNSFELSLGRWQRQAVSLKPSLVESSLQWEGAAETAALSNAGLSPLHDIYIKGVGTQKSLAPGQQLIPSVGEDAPLPDVYTGLLEHVPPGTALARDGGVFHVSLPPFGTEP